MQSLIFWFQWFFSKTLPAGRLLGIPMRVHLALVLFVPFLGYAFYQGWAPALGIGGGLLFALLYIAVLYLSVTAHEYGHAWGNRLVGGHTDMIILTPVGGMAIGSGADASPRAELIVTALGPAVSVLLAVAAHAGLWLLPSPAALWSDGRTLALWGVLLVGIVASVNTMLALFNLLFPLFPMDSARLIRAALSMRFNPQHVTLRVCQLGTGLGIALLIAFFFRVQVPFLGMVSGWLALIGILGIQACLWEQDRIRQMPVYGRSDEWGARTIYYDSDLVVQARRQASDDVRGLLRLKPETAGRRRAAAPAPRGGNARIIDLAEPINPEDISDRRKLAEMMREAANAEDFLLAGRIQRRLRHLDERDSTREG